MTRRADRQPGRVLSLSAYIHRATLGLPNTDRLDAAAELRAHLLERVTELQGQGYPRDEAEYLAVRAMGDPGVTNRQMLGHFFTTPGGWAALGVVLLAGGGVWANQTFKPAGIWLSTPRSTDDRAINRIYSDQWPRPWGSAFDFSTRTADLRFPKGTQHVAAAWMSYGDTEFRPSFGFWLSLGAGYGRTARQVNSKSAADAPYSPNLWGSKFRFVATAAPDISRKSCPEGRYQSGTLIYSGDKPKLSPGISINDRGSITSFAGLASGFCVRAVNNPIEVYLTPLILNSSSKICQLWSTIDKKQVSYALVLYPTDQAELPSIKPEQAYVFRPDMKTWGREKL